MNLGDMINQELIDEAEDKDLTSSSETSANPIETYCWTIWSKTSKD